MENYPLTNYQTFHTTTASILVVDDEPAFCGVMSELLRSFGYEVRFAYNVDQAMAHIQDALPDIILTDVMMPGIDGLNFIRRLHKEPELAKIPTIVVSAKAEGHDIRATKEAGADACLIKPFSASELRQTISQFLHG